MECGFNLLVYGVGSKQKLLNEFADQAIRNAGEPLMIVNGYHSGANLKSMLTEISKFITVHIEKGTGSQKKKTFASIHDQCENIKNTFTRIKNGNLQFNNFYILIHSFDMGALKNDEWLLYMSELASTNKIKFIISIDHVKAGSIWTDQVLDNFNFYSLQLDTYADYENELSYAGPLFSS